MRPGLLLFGIAALWISGGVPASGAESLPEPGPENGGLRLRLVIHTEAHAGQDTHHVRLDLLNVTEKPITLTANWLWEHPKGDFKDYLEDAASMETYPRVYQEAYQIMVTKRESPQPKYVLKSKEILTVQWETSDGRLKTAKTDYLGTENPVFSVPGLYAVRAMVNLGTSEGEILLRSNEQQVSVGSSRKMPPHLCATLSNVNLKERRASVDLGTLHGIKAGDRFLFRDGFQGFWCLTLTSVMPWTSWGTFYEADLLGNRTDRHGSEQPSCGRHARLLMDKAPVRQSSAASRPGQ